jgi:hypothetical protein
MYGHFPGEIKKKDVFHQFSLYKFQKQKMIRSENIISLGH